MLAAPGIRDLAQIGIDSIYIILHCLIKGSIDMVAALLDLLQHQLTGSIVPLEAGLLGHRLGNILNNRIAKP